MFDVLKKIHWTNALFLTLTPLITCIFLPIHIYNFGWNWVFFIFFVISCIISGMSITAGYHRLFSHRSYESNTLLKIIYLFFGAGTFQGSALKWSSDHRRHHKFVDSIENDPYSINKGFWFAHIGWLYSEDNPNYRNQFPNDLVNDYWVNFQHRYYVPLGIFVGFGIPALLGYFFNDVWGGLLYGGFARIVFSHHTTFFINSIAHFWGSQPYGDKNSGRDNPVLAFFTFGEGYHNFHHRFEADYRNGIKWYHWDPTKWLIKLSAWMGFAKNLRKIADVEILRARLQADEKKLVQVGLYDQRFQDLHHKINELQKKFAQFKQSYYDLKKDLSAQSEEKIRNLKRDIRAVRLEMKISMSQWRRLCYAQLRLARVQSI